MSSQGSRLEQIQMRYQQKQMSGNDQKKSDTFSETQKLLTSSLGAGKVRAMFDERRHRINAGIDKSYLLDPITVESKSTATKGVIAPAKSVRLDHKMSNYSKVIVPPLQNRYKSPDVTSNNNTSATRDEQLDKSRNLKKASAIAKPNSRVGSSSKVAPVNSTPSALKNLTNQRSPTRSTKSGSSIIGSGNTARASPKATMGVSSRSITPKQRTSALSLKNENSPRNSFDDDDDDDDAPVPEGLVKCGICKRNFAEDRIEKHQVICQKTKTKKRKIFDASKKRVQGTEAESYLRKPTHVQRSNKVTTPTSASSKASNWRSKHEDFIKTIRAAKEMKAFLAKGGKLSDLPPPPPSENPDYVQCPHCSRRFNEAAANRHIPICQNMQHNKPKPKPSAGKLTNSTKRR